MHDIRLLNEDKPQSDRRFTKRNGYQIQYYEPRHAYNQSTPEFH